MKYIYSKENEKFVGQLSDSDFATSAYIIESIYKSFDSVQGIPSSLKLVDTTPELEPALKVYELQADPEFVLADHIESLKDGIRQHREHRLKESDWTQLPDSPLSAEKKAEWATYRQALRDLPSSVVTGEEEIVWPAKPE